MRFRENHAQRTNHPCMFVGSVCNIYFFDETTIEPHSLEYTTLECVHCHTIGLNSENKRK